MYEKKIAEQFLMIIAMLGFDEHENTLTEANIEAAMAVNPLLRCALTVFNQVMRPIIVSDATISLAFDDGAHVPLDIKPTVIGLLQELEAVTISLN